MVRRNRAALVARCLLPMLLLSGLPGCAGEEERQPTEAELHNYTNAIDRDAESERANSIEVSRAKEDAVDRAHTERMRRQD